VGGVNRCRKTKPTKTVPTCYNKIVVKKTILLLLCLLVFSTTSFAKFISVATDEAYIREEPGPDALIDIGVPPYYPLYVIEQVEDWYKVRDWMNTVGWIDNDSVTSETTVIVNKLKINWRTGPGTRYGRIGKLLRGSILKVIGRKGQWLKLKLVDPPEGTVGWAYSTLVWGD
jgi:uncharacterized protein YgiM (DUF1202 family)